MVNVRRETKSDQISFPLPPVNIYPVKQYDTWETIGGGDMGVVQATQSDVVLLARLLRAEAEGEGVVGELLVGNVGINRL